MWGRKRMLEELEKDIRDHIEREMQDNIARGMTPEEARYAARRKFGNVTRVKEEVREVWSFAWLEQFLQDLRFGGRMLRRSPGFTAVAMLTLVLGIGANTAIFSVVNAALLRPLPYADPASLMMVWESNSKLPHADHNVVSPPDYLDWKTQSDVFRGMAGIFDQRVNLTGRGLPEQIILQDVTADFFSVLGVSPILDPGFTPENGQQGHDNVVILSFGFWKERFAGDPNIVGKSIILNGHPLAIVGVAP